MAHDSYVYAINGTPLPDAVRDLRFIRVPRFYATGGVLVDVSPTMRRVVSARPLRVVGGTQPCPFTWEAFEAPVDSFRDAKFRVRALEMYLQPVSLGGVDGTAGRLTEVLPDTDMGDGAVLEVEVVGVKRHGP